MAEWDRLVLRCSNNLPVTVSEKLIDGTFELCFITDTGMDCFKLNCKVQHILMILCSQLFTSKLLKYLATFMFMPSFF
jgi:hypothetical protein